MNYVLNRFIVVAAAFSLSVCQGVTADAVRLATALMGDSYTLGELVEYPTNKWLALHYQSGAWKLSPSKVVFDMTPERDFVVIETSVKNRALLFRAKNLGAGAVILLGGEACVSSEAKGCPSLEREYTNSKFQLGNNRYELIFKRTGFATVSGTTFKKWRFGLRQMQPTLLEQVIEEDVLDNSLRNDVDHPLRINALGDFDGDGKIDLVYSFTNQESPEVGLYLSSEAKSGQLVGKAKPLKK